MYHSCYANRCYASPYGDAQPKKHTTRLEAIWDAVDQTPDDDVAIAMVESVPHLGFGKDEDKP